MINDVMRKRKQRHEHFLIIGKLFLYTISMHIFSVCLFPHSYLNRSNLKETCEVEGVKQLVPTRVGGTRWLPHTLRALNNMWTLYPALVLHLSQVNTYSQILKKILVRVLGCTAIILELVYISMSPLVQYVTIGNYF